MSLAISSPYDSLGVPGMQEPLMTGTTLVAAEFDGGVVIGADSRTSMGTYVANRATDKLTPLSEKIFCCRSGSAADTQAVAAIVTSHIESLSIAMDMEPRVRVAANTTRDIVYRYREQLLAGIIVAGWDSLEGGQVYCVPLGGMMVRQKVAIGGSGSAFIYGYLDKTFREGMSAEETVEFVKDAVTMAIARDGSSGGGCRIAIITKDGVERRNFDHTQLPSMYEG